MAGEFIREYSVDDEQIDRYCALPDALVIPGHDATESWEWEKIYINAGTEWRKM